MSLLWSAWTSSLVVPITLRWSGDAWTIADMPLDVRDAQAQAEALRGYAPRSMLEHRCNAQWAQHELDEEENLLASVPLVRSTVSFDPLSTVDALACTSAAGAAIVDGGLARKIARHAGLPFFASHVLRKGLIESRRRRLGVFGRMSPVLEAIAAGERLTLHAGDGSYWDNCALVGALCGARRGDDARVFMFGSSMPAWGDYFSNPADATPSIMSCIITSPRLFGPRHTVRVVRRDGPCYHLRLSGLITVPNEYGVEAGVCVTLDVIGNERIDAIDVMPVAQQIHSPALDALVAETCDFFQTCSQDGEPRHHGAVPRIALPGGGMRSMIVAVCALRTLPFEPQVVSATSGGGWGAVSHYFAREPTPIAEMCRRVKVETVTRAPSWVEGYADLVDAKYDWTVLIRRMFQGVCANVPTRSDVPHRLLLSSCLLVDDPA